MGQREELQAIMTLAALDLISLTNHALYDKLQPMGLDGGDVRHALMNANDIQPSDPYHHASDWMVTGPDRDGNDLTVCVVIEDKVRVVTVF